MSDITKAELSAKLSGDVKTWWDSTSDLPTTVSMNELFNRLLIGAFLAQTAKNTGVAAGSQIAGYNAPAYGTTTLDIASGIQSQVVTVSVSTRIPLNPDVGVSPLV